MRAVAELDAIETAQRAVEAVDARLAERRKKLEELAAERVTIEQTIRATSIAGEIGRLGALTATAAQLADAEEALTVHAIPALEAEREAASNHVSQLRAAEQFEKIRTQEPSAREAVRVADVALSRAVAAVGAAVHERENAYVRLRDVAAALAEGGRPVAVPVTTRKFLETIGCGRGVLFQLGVERLEIPIPAGVPFF